MKAHESSTAEWDPPAPVGSAKLNGFKKGLSDNRALAELVERALEAQRKKGKRRSLHPAERLRATSDPKEVKKWGDATGKFNLAE